MTSQRLGWLLVPGIRHARSLRCPRSGETPAPAAGAWRRARSGAPHQFGEMALRGRDRKQIENYRTRTGQNAH
jgi:hypothetical protein